MGEPERATIKMKLFTRLLCFHLRVGDLCVLWRYLFVNCSAFVSGYLSMRSTFHYRYEKVLRFDFQELIGELQWSEVFVLTPVKCVARLKFCVVTVRELRLLPADGQSYTRNSVRSGAKV